MENTIISKLMPKRLRHNDINSDEASPKITRKKSLYKHHY